MLLNAVPFVTSKSASSYLIVTGVTALQKQWEKHLEIRTKAK